MKLIYLILILVTLIFCKGPELNNPSDPKSKDFIETQILECNTRGSLLCPPFRVKGFISGLTAGNTLRIQYLLGAPSDEIVTNGQFDIITRGGLFPQVYVSKQPNNLHCIVTNPGRKSGDDVEGLEITCPLFKTFTNNKEVGISRCAYGQEWNPSGIGDCTGAGTSGTQYNISLYLNFCNISPSRGCTNDIAGGELSSPPWIGSADSDIYNACSQYNTNKKFQITNWRVPTKDELKQIVVCNSGPSVPLNDFIGCNVGYTSPTLNTSIFTNLSSSNILWSSTSYSLDDIQAFALDLNTGQMYTPDQDSTNQVLCVTDL
ncbi:DUF1566 domain-containing protein [Leptospira kemamanensis]|uniref:DUF1566 domain-containing protein n=1 Tax=Leptospira kemamanensis TaxID=2484942 RepID=A0A4R9JVE2_9LEPT|nr:DUF1566 domain-containing protein [Leptospira kemamanensis]TGL55963.1 DUF1566 domain-containing protein [Leptospira kemamanensis]